MTPGNRGDVGKDQDGNDDGSWWGTSSSPNEHGGDHISHYTDDGRISYDTDSTGNYVSGSGHEVDSDGNVTGRWD